MPHTHVELSQTGIQGRPHDEHEHLKIHRLNEKLPATDESHYLLVSLCEISAGEPVPAHYHGPTVAYIIEGEVHVKDESKPGALTKLVAGDVIHIDHGSRNTFQAVSPNKAKFFAASYAPSHIHPEDYILKK